MLEIHRILKPGGIVKIEVPLYNPMLAHMRHTFTRDYFKVLCKDKNKSGRSKQQQDFFKKIKTKLIFKRIAFHCPFFCFSYYYEMEKL